MEFARELTVFSMAVVWPSDVDLLYSLVVLEQFKNSLPKYIAVYLAEHRVETG